MIAVNLGRIAYDEALRLQERCHEARVEGRIDDVILFLEHDPVITFGSSAVAEDLLVTEEELARQGIPVHHVHRGGKITCHYPGQLIGYFIIALDGLGRDIHLFVRGIEEAIIRVLADCGVRGETIRHMTGVWTGNSKIAAIGIEVRKGVTMHGFSLNIRDNAPIYSFFIPCGIRDRGVTSLEKCLGPGRIKDIAEVSRCFLRHWSEVFQTPVASSISPKELEMVCRQRNEIDDSGLLAARATS
jgi:lipoate-protein ligase B